MAKIGKKTFHVTMQKTYCINVEEENADNAFTEAINRDIVEWEVVSIEHEVELCEECDD